MDELLEQCARACDVCASECQLVLAAESTYASGSTRFTPEQIALIACADVCKVTASGIREKRERLAELCLWCAEVCEGLASTAALSGDRAVLEACRRSAALCRRAASPELRAAPQVPVREEQAYAVATADWSDDIRLGAVLRLLDRVRAAFGMDVVFVSQFVDGRRVFRYVGASETALDLVQLGASDPLEESYCKRVVDGRLPEVIRNAQELPEAMALEVTRAINLGGHLSVPIQLGTGDVFGTLCCFSQRPHPELEERDAVVLRELAGLVAKAIWPHSAGRRGS